MADDLEVFDFASDEFNKNDLVEVLNEMVVEYKKLSDSFNELNLKKMSDSKYFQTIKTDDLQTKLTELAAKMRRLQYVISS